MGKFFLVYVNFIGKNHKGKYLYEFIFSDTLKDVDGIDWDVFPASGRPETPHEIFIKKVGIFEYEMKFHVIQNSDSFAIWDAIDGVIALCWEDISDYETYPDNRLFFKYGETIDDVIAKLYNNDKVLKFDNK